MTDLKLFERRLLLLIQQLVDEGNSQEVIAEKTESGLTQAAISLWMKGKRHPKYENALVIGRAFGVRDAFFTDESLGDEPRYRDHLFRKKPTETVERDDVPRALEEYFAERETSGRPVRSKVRDRARASARSTGMATRTEAAALVDFLEGVVAREERGDAPPPNDPRAVINEAAGQRAVTRKPRKR